MAGSVSGCKQQQLKFKKEEEEIMQKNKLQAENHMMRERVSKGTFACFILEKLLASRKKQISNKQITHYQAELLTSFYLKL